MTTCPQRQRQWPPCIPTAKITSRQWPANQRATNRVSKTLFVLWKVTKLECTMHHWSLFLFGWCFIDIFCLCCILLCYNRSIFFRYKNVAHPKNGVILLLNFPIMATSLQWPLLCPQGGCCGEVLLLCQVVWFLKGKFLDSLFIC